MIARSPIVRVGGTSIMGLMMLSAAPGTTITVEAFGPQAAEVLDTREALVASRYHLVNQVTIEVDRKRQREREARPHPQ